MGDDNNNIFYHLPLIISNSIPIFNIIDSFSVNSITENFYSYLDNKLYIPSPTVLLFIENVNNSNNYSWQSTCLPTNTDIFSYKSGSTTSFASSDGISINIDTTSGSFNPLASYDNYSGLSFNAGFVGTISFTIPVINTNPLFGCLLVAAGGKGGIYKRYKDEDLITYGPGGGGGGIIYTTNTTNIGLTISNSTIYNISVGNYNEGNYPGYNSSFYTSTYNLTCYGGNCGSNTFSTDGGIGGSTNIESTYSNYSYYGGDGGNGSSSPKNGDNSQLISAFVPYINTSIFCSGGGGGFYDYKKYANGGNGYGGIVYDKYNIKTNPNGYSDYNGGNPGGGGAVGNNAGSGVVHIWWSTVADTVPEVNLVM
jgi:hypothetical protein